MRILITGHKGVLGTRLREQLSINYPQFTQIYLRSNLLDASAVSSEIEQLKNIDMVLHLASIVAVDKVKENVELARAVNVGGTRTILAALKQFSQRPKFLLASSSHVYGFSDTPFMEDDFCNPSSVYGQLKLEAEKECQLYAETHGFSVVIGRIFSMWDHLQQPPFLFPSLRRRIMEHGVSGPLEIYGANSLRDFQSATAVAKQLLKLSLIDVNGVFNIASGNPMTVGNFACDIIAERNLDVIHTGERSCLIANTSKTNSVFCSDQVSQKNEN